MYMNKQTSEMLKILLSSPGQHFTCEALAEYLHVSTRTIRNYMTTIRDFMNQNGKEDAPAAVRRRNLCDGNCRGTSDAVQSIC